MRFDLGCNYWAPNAGTDMWRDWQEDLIDENLGILAQNGVRVLRVFPNWRDFQPVIPILSGQGSLKEYRMEDESLPANPWYLSPVMLERFGLFCGLCEKHGLRLIVGLLTGWMSGRLFVPPVLTGRNLYTDPTALLFEQRMVAGMVTCFKGRPCIAAWDLGNECNCMSEAENEDIATNWTGIIANTIRANDPTRPVISGMHSLGVTKEQAPWTIRGQAEFTDLLTTHPYPYWVRHAGAGRILSFRTLIQASAETRMYADLSGKKCLVEEIGTMGPMICSNRNAADFLRVNIWSNLAAGSPGLLWWCANEQLNLFQPPYSYQMCELELGLLDKTGQPKPVLTEMKRLSEALAKIPYDLPETETDAVCILTEGQDAWAVAYMTCAMAKQAGMNLRFAHANDPLPAAKLYLMPSVSGHIVMNRENYLALLEKVRQGAVLYLSVGDGYLAEFGGLTGTGIIDSETDDRTYRIRLGDAEIPIRHQRHYHLQTAGAEVLARDENGEPEITSNAYGSGTVIYANFPAEAMLLNDPRAFESDRGILYRTLFGTYLKDRIAEGTSFDVPVTVHRLNDHEAVCIAVNCSGEERKDPLRLAEGWYRTECLYGREDNSVDPYDASVWLISGASE